MSDGLVGVWRLVSHVMENTDTGERSEPFGPHPRGTLMFDAGGRMAALITPGADGTPGERPAGDPRSLVAYSGRYRFEPPDRFVTTVDIAWIEAWIGTEQVRRFRRDGDRLEIATMPMPAPGEGAGASTVVGILSWVRETGATADA